MLIMCHTDTVMWVSGCILGELLGGKPMFPGASTMNQLDKVVEVTGVSPLPHTADSTATSTPPLLLLL